MQTFIKVKDEIKPGLCVGLMLSNKQTDKDVGIEIEVEGKNLLHEGEPPKPWTYHVDPSLRGEESAEYVLAKPIDFDEVPKALEGLFAKLSANNATFDDSNRTSVHVHLNCQQFHLDRLTSFVALWFALEEVLTEWCGEYRVGNLFCLRAVDAPAIITHLKKFIVSDGKEPLHEGLRYAALNPNALHKYGSLEVRTLQGCHEPKAIADWVAILARLHKLSAQFRDPTEIVGLFSQGGPISFFKTILGELAEGVRLKSGMSESQISASMFRGIRFAQQLAYCRDWSLYRKLDVKPCPFGRDLKKVAAKLVQSGPVLSQTPAAPDWYGSAQVDPEPEYDDQPATAPSPSQWSLEQAALLYAEQAAAVQEFSSTFDASFLNPIH